MTDWVVTHVYPSILSDRITASVYLAVLNKPWCTSQLELFEEKEVRAALKLQKLQKSFPVPTHPTSKEEVIQCLLRAS